MRVDFNVPLKDGIVADPTRIQATVPSIEFLLEHGASQVVLMSHLGRPKGQRDSKFSLKPVVPALQDMINKHVWFVDNCVGKPVEESINDSESGSVLLLENVRFHLEEEGKGVIGGEKVTADPKNVLKFR